MTEKNEGIQVGTLVSSYVAERSATVEPWYISTLWAALTHRKTLTVATFASLAYLFVFAFASGMLSRVQGSQFTGVQEFPHFELYLNPVAYMPYLVYQPLRSWYLEVNLIQAGELVIMGSLVMINVALSGVMWRFRNRSARQASSSLFAMAPFFISNSACAACAGIPAGLAFLPASVAGGLLAFAGFYGISAILVIITLVVTMNYSLYKANGAHISHMARNNSTETHR